MAGKEGGHAGSGQDKSWLAQFQSVKLLTFRRYSVCVVAEGRSFPSNVSPLEPRCTCYNLLEVRSLNSFIAHMLASITAPAGFGMNLPRDPGVDLSQAKDVVFLATREIWRFLVSTTLCSI